MSIGLLVVSAHTLFIIMLLTMIVVALLFGFMVFMLLRMRKKENLSDADNVKGMLARRESSIVVEIMRNEKDEVKRTELVGKLRRVKMAQMLIDELIREEEGILKEIDAEENSKKAHVKDDAENAAKPAQHDGAPKARPVQQGGPVQRKVPPRPRDMSSVNGVPAQRPVQRPVQNPAQKPAGPDHKTEMNPTAKPVQTEQKPAASVQPPVTKQTENAEAAKAPEAKPAANEQKADGTQKPAEG